MKNKFLGIPYIIWMAIFVVIPLFLILGYALTTRDGGITLENFTKLASYTGVFADSFLLAIIATLVCLIIGYPIAYWMTKEGPGFKRIAMIVLMILNAVLFPSLLSRRVQEVGYSDFLKMVDEGKVKEVSLEEDAEQIVFIAVNDKNKKSCRSNVTALFVQDKASVIFSI